MRNIYSFMVAAVAMFAAISCAKEINDLSTVKPSEPVETIVFTASFGEETKAKLNGMKSEWVANDKIAIFEGTNSFEFTTTDSGASVDFNASVSGFNGTSYIGIYPYSAHHAANVGRYVAYGNIPTKQTATNGSYDPNAALSVAYSQDKTLSFQNAHALLQFTVTGQNATGATFAGNNSEFVSGKVGATLKNNGEVDVIEFKDNHLYFKPNSNWKLSNARFAAYFFQGQDNYVWVNMTQVGDVYEVAIPTDKTYSNVIFCRMNPNHTDNRWNTGSDTDATKRLWNQTADLVIPTNGNNLYTYTENTDNWDKGSGSWGAHEVNFTYAELNGTLDNGTYYLVVAPQDFSKGFHIELHFGNKKMKIKNLATDYSIEPNKIYNLGSLDYKLYFKPNDNWKLSNARFAAYFYEGDTYTWVNMSDPDKDGIYEVLVPAEKWYPNVIFCRMNPNHTDNRWNTGSDTDATKRLWNQTADLVIPTSGNDLCGQNNLYSYTDNTNWDKGSGKWSKK